MNAHHTRPKVRTLPFWQTPNVDVTPRDEWARLTAEHGLPVLVVAQDDETRRYIVQVAPRVLADCNAETFDTDGTAIFWRIVVTEGGDVIAACGTLSPAHALRDLTRQLS